MMGRRILITICALTLWATAWGQNTQALRAQADALFDKGEYAEAYPLYSQLASLDPHDHVLNFKFGTCALYGDGDKSRAIGYLKYAVGGPDTPPLAWYFLGRAYQLNYQFSKALEAYNQFKGVADNRSLARNPVENKERQCRNGLELLNKIKDIQVARKVEVEANDFFRFYDLDDIGGKIVVTPEELLSNYDRRSGEQFLLYLPDDHQRTIYFSSYGRDGKTGRDLYRTHLLPTGDYAEPRKLGGYVNSKYDEDFGVMAPDGSTFYFCSKGHNSMGGYDVFKSVYDAGLDVFGIPENMDFAVNTPANELLYIVGADGSQACFASDRDSRQGMLNVYRVSTRQEPVNITVFKGTYNAAIAGGADQHARIMVEDARTRKQVATAITNERGEYVLALPRGGPYRILVEDAGKEHTFWANVEVPAEKEPRAYAQELTLLPSGKLQVTNHYDDPLDEDLMALVMDEVRRRAQLDVTEPDMDLPEQPVASADGRPALGDVLRETGFDAGLTLKEISAMAADAAAAAQDDREKLAHRSTSAMSMAIQNLNEAESASKEAVQLARQVEEAPSERQREQLLEEAAAKYVRSEEALARARAAYATAGQFEQAASAAGEQAHEAAAIGQLLGNKATLPNTEELTTALADLRSLLNDRTGPQARPDEVEKARTHANEAQRKAQVNMNRAVVMREEEVAMVERLARLERASQSTRAAKKKEQLQEQLAELTAQHKALEEEVAEAFRQARNAETDAAVARGQLELTRFLSTAPLPDVSEGQEPPSIAGVDDRIRKVSADNATLDLTSRAEHIVAGISPQREATVFNWSDDEAWAQAGPPAIRRTGSDEQATGVTQGHPADNQEPPSTQEAERTTTLEEEGAAHTQGRTASNDTGEATGRVDDEHAADRERGEALQADIQGQEEERQTAVADHGGPDGQRTETDTATLHAEEEGSDTLAAHGASPSSSRQDGETGRTAAADGGLGDAQTPGAQAAGEDGTGTGHPLADGQPSHAAADQGSFIGNGDRPGTPTRTGREAARMTSEEEPSEADLEGVPAEEQAFMIANRLAELQQLRGAERNRDRRDSLDQAIARERAALNDLQASSTAAAVPPTDPAAAHWRELNYLAHDPATLEKEMVEDAFQGFSLAWEAVEQGEGTPEEKAMQFRALEKQLADSIDVRIDDLMTTLEESPDSAEAILTAIDRWRALKEAHLANTEKILADLEHSYSPAETRAFEDRELAKVASPPQGEQRPPAIPSTLHNNAYVDIATEPNEIFSSHLEPRSPKGQQALDELQRDLYRQERLQEAVDSIRMELAEVDDDRAYDRTRQRMDRNIDDLLINKVDMAQRSAFITRSEMNVASDSMKVLARRIARMGVGRDEPLAGMAASYEQTAAEKMKAAKALRKKADNGRDIQQRISAYQEAYATELQALREMDRALVVRNYMLDPQFQPGEALAYEEIEQRLFAEEYAAATKALTTAQSHPAAPGTEMEEAIAAQEREQEPDQAGPGRQDTAWQAPPGAVTTADQPASAPPQERVAAAGAEQALPVVEDREPASAMETPSAAGSTAEQDALDRYLTRYYYLDEARSEQLMEHADERHYFGIKGHALEQREQATIALESATSAEELAAGLRDEIAKIEEAEEQIRDERRLELLQARASQLTHQADSLRQVANQALETANLDDSQAATWLQGLPATRSAELMDLEQTSRRTEPVLARTVPDRPEAPSRATPVDIPVAAIAPAGEPASTSATTVEEESPEERVATTGSVVTERTTARAEGPGRLSPTASAAAGLRAPLQRDVLVLEEVPEARTAPIPIDQPMPAGIVFKVQVGAFRNQIPLQAFSDMAPVTGEQGPNGLIRYTAGLFTTPQAASEAGARIRARGYRDAFVAAYIDGRRVPLREAIQAQQHPARQVDAEEDEAPRTTIAQVEGPVPPAPQAPPSTATTIDLQAPATRTAAENAVLAEYPPTVEEVLASFTPAPTDYYNDPDAAPATQVETLRGLFFTVQVGVYSRPTPLDRLFNISPLNSELTPDRKIRYTTGVYRNEAQATARRQEAVALGVGDAFITAYLNGERIALRDARLLLARFGDAILIDRGRSSQ